MWGTETISDWEMFGLFILIGLLFVSPIILPIIAGGLTGLAVKGVTGKSGMGSGFTIGAIGIIISIPITVISATVGAEWWNDYPPPFIAGPICAILTVLWVWRKRTKLRLNSHS